MKKFLALLVLIMSFTVEGWSACSITNASPYMGQVFINELYKGSTNSSSTSNKIEIYNPNNYAWSGWKIIVQRSGRTAQTFTLSSGFANDKNSDFIYNTTKKFYLRNSSTVYDIALLDQNGKLIDYITLNGTGPQNSTYSCIINPTAISVNGKKDIYRTTDGGSTWATTSSPSTANSIGYSNICPTGYYDLILTKDADTTTPMVGDTVTFTLNASNTCKNTAANVTVTDVIPLGFTYASNTCSGTYTSSTKTFSKNFGTFALGDNQSCDILTTATTAGSYTNTATLTSTTTGQSSTTDDTDFVNLTIFSNRTISMDLATDSVLETDGTGSFTINLSSPYTKDILVDYTVSGTASRPSDHDLANGTATIVTGDTSVDILFNIIDNTQYEADETIIVTLSNPRPKSGTLTLTLDNPSAETITIQDNDAPIIIDNNPAANSVPENSVGGISVGITAYVNNNSSNNAITFSLFDNAGGRFAINSSTGVVTVAGGLDYETATSHSITVQATGFDGAVGTQIFTIAVTNVNEAPVITAPNSGNAYTASVPENTTAVATVVATDPDAGQTLSYSLSGADAAKFSITSGGVITFLTAPNFESPTDTGGDNTYNVTVTVSDNGSPVLTDTQTFAITVSNANEAPTDIALTNASVPENQPSGTTVGTLSTTDPDAGDAFTYSLLSGDTSVFNISSNQLKTAASFDFETKSSYTVTIRSTDQNGLYFDKTFTIALTDVNEAPVITSGATGTVAENAPISTVVYTITATDVDAGQTLTYSIGGTDAGAFNINSSTGDVTLKASADYETKSSYSITLTATDNGSPILFASQTVTISVTNSNEAPVITDPNSGNAYTASVPENTTAITDINATDLDAGQTLSYSLSGADAALFSINSSTGVVTFTTAPDFENPTDSGTNNMYDFSVEVSDNGSPVLTDTQSFTITVTNLNDNPVVITDSNASTNSVPENASIGTAVGISVSASDADIGATITSYRLTNNAGGLFAIDPSTHIITVAGVLDYETATSHTITVEVNSSDGSSVTKNFDINVTDVQEVPVADYHLDECIWNGTTGEVKDSSGNNLHGTAQGSAQISLNGVIDHAGTFNNSASNTDAIIIPDSDLLSPHVGTNGEITVSAWVKLNSYPTSALQGRIPIVAKGDNDNWEYALYVYQDHKAGFSVWQSNGSGYKEISGGNLALNTWYHVTGVLKKGAYERVYVNGALVAESTSGFSGSTTNGTSALYIARRGSGNNFLNGYVDEVKVFPNALSSAQISAIENNESMGKNYDGTSRTASCCCLPTGGNLIANPSFETLCGTSIVQTFGNVAGGTVNMRNNVCGWTMNGSGMETWENTTSPSASDGTVFVEIDGYDTTVDQLSQILSTVSGTHYVISFDYRARIGGSDRIIAKWNGTANGTFTGITTGWQTAQIEVVGTGLDTLAFEEPSADNNSYGSWIDNIRVAEGTLYTPTYRFDGWDSFRSISDRNISTKIVNKPFTLTIASINETNNGFQDFNGTVCAQILNNTNQTISGWNKLLFTDRNTTTTAFTINRAIGGSDSAKLKLSWKKNVDSTCPITGEDNSTIASDRFAIRPISFDLTTSNAVAGVDFNITFTAPNFSGVPSSDYNETAGNSFTVTTAEHNASCLNGTFNPDPNSIWSFVNGAKIFTTRYNEVGMVDINISDTDKPCASRFAKEDCDDANVSDGTNFTADLLPIGLTPKSIIITPHHFDVNATLSNFAGGTFTYLSTDLNMSAQLDLNITAKTSDGNTTKNYTAGCYSKDTTLTMPHSTVPAPLSKILYHDSLTLTDANITKTDPITSTYNASKFNQGSVTPQITLNFDRSRSSAMNPFDFNITSATATDVDITGTTTPLGVAKFVYGRVRAYDIATNVSPVDVPVEFEVYSTTSSGFVSGMPQNVLKWYRNLNHNAADEGNVIQGGFSAGATDAAVNTSAEPANGIQIVTVTSTQDKTVHLDISPWLWYSSKYGYLYSGACTQHPCFNYDYTDAAAGVKGVNSGTFKGSDFQMTPAKNITNKGVKIFR